VKCLHVAKGPKKLAPLSVIDLIVLFIQPTIYLMLESEMLHRREYLTKRMGNLCHGRYLQVEGPALDLYGKGMHLGFFRRIHLHMNPIIRKLEVGTVKPEALCLGHKPQETWDRKPGLLKEGNLELLEARGGDPKHNYLHVIANSCKLKIAKVRKCDALCY
jgi:hypothetical protein